MNGHNKKIDAELIVDSREVLETRPRSTPPPPHSDHDAGCDEREDEERWENAPCTD